MSVHHLTPAAALDRFLVDRFVAWLAGHFDRSDKEYAAFRLGGFVIVAARDESIAARELEFVVENILDGKVQDASTHREGDAA